MYSKIDSFSVSSTYRMFGTGGDHRLLNLMAFQGIKHTKTIISSIIIEEIIVLIHTELTGFEPALFCVTGRHVRPLHHSSWVVCAPD